MLDDFRYDVFLSHSSKDKVVVRDVAERLRSDGVRVWLDEWEILPGDSIPAKIEEGLDHSRVLVLCMSANAFGSDWAQLESGTYRFRDPLNKERRFIPLRLDGTPVKGSLTQFLYLDWLTNDRAETYAKLLEACRPPASDTHSAHGRATSERAIKLSHPFAWTYAFSRDGKRAITGLEDHNVCLWDVETGRQLALFKGHTDAINSVALSDDLCLAISGSEDSTVRVWNLETGQLARVLEGHQSKVKSVALSTDRRLALSGSFDDTIRLWDIETGRCLRVLSGHGGTIYSVKFSADQRKALSGAWDQTLRLWELRSGDCLKKLSGDAGLVDCVDLSPDQHFALSCGDSTIRLWDVTAGQCVRVFEGHTADVQSVAWNTDQSFFLSGSSDSSVRLWSIATGSCVGVLKGHEVSVRSVAWSANGRYAISGDLTGNIRVWDLSSFTHKVLDRKDRPLPIPFDQVQYTNAKVLLVGESGAGKTGLSKRLATNDWEPTDSTVGVWATQWKLPVASVQNGVEREIWLWDFGGQADQRLIHQLYMDETAVAVLVFDGQKDDVFETLGQWDRDLTRSSRKAFSKLLVAGRVDAGGLRVSRSQIEIFAKERGFTQFLETSAKRNIGCDALGRAILDGIRWENIPWRSSPLLFKRLKEEIVRLKDAGRVLMRLNELRETLTLRLTGESARFTVEELKAVISLLSGPGVVWELKFGSWVLLQPERINAYAQAVIQTMRSDEGERGCLLEERVLSGDLTYHSSIARLEADEERFILLAMHQTLVERGLCLRQQTDEGALLIFPSYYRRERPELIGHPAVLVSYRFNGFLDDIYATLVVRLHHTKPFRQDQLWRYAADFKTLVGRQLGVKLTRRAEGAGELEVYFDPAIGIGEKIIFSKYVHEHLLQNALNVVRLRHYVCPHCGTTVGNREVAMRKLAEGKKTILCVNCEKRVPLWDEMEQLFASPDTNQQVRELQKQSATALNGQSRARALVGEVISTVTLAGQLSRELPVNDHGIDMEIEFTSDEGQATGRKLHLVLKSQQENVKTFSIDLENARHWTDQQFRVLLVARHETGELRWMDVSTKSGKRIAFHGERFDVMSVRHWRDNMLG